MIYSIELSPTDDWTGSAHLIFHPHPCSDALKLTKETNKRAETGTNNFLICLDPMTTTARRERRCSKYIGEKIENCTTNSG